MAEQRLITVAIHTYEKALMLRSILESEGVGVVLQNVNLVQPVVSSGVRVRIKESDLPLALRIIENIDIFAGPRCQVSDNGNTVPRFIVPVDFSAYSMKACEIAFSLASKHRAEILILHSFIAPVASTSLQFSDSLNYDADNIVEAEMQESLEQLADKQIKNLTLMLRERIKEGTLPPVKFSTRIEEGLPEDVIVQVAKEVKPHLIVMGTRGASNKERDMIGSVTAEVLDSCRFPILTLPEGCANVMPAKMEVLYFSHLDQEDMLALDALYRLFPTTDTNVTIVNVPGRKQPSDTGHSLDALLKYCRSHYPGYTFELESLQMRNVTEDYNRITADRHIDLIIAPSKRRSVFARIFNPGLPHRLLFHADVPMMMIPV